MWRKKLDTFATRERNKTLLENNIWKKNPTIEKYVDKNRQILIEKKWNKVKIWQQLNNVFENAKSKKN